VTEWRLCSWPIPVDGATWENGGTVKKRKRKEKEEKKNNKEGGKENRQEGWRLRR
jgi:hypothetical protein